MKVYIGPYKNWFGPYQLADLLKYLWVSEDTCYKIGKKLEKTWLNNFLLWLDSKKKRNIKVKIHNYDVWNFDHTLSLIILPLLIKLKERKQGVPDVYNEDVPDNLKTYKGYHDDDFESLQKKWNYVLDEMIFAFQSKQEDWESQFCSGEIDIIWEKTDNENFLQMVKGPKDTFKIDSEGRKKYQERISNGFKLFGKYYESLYT